MAGLLDTVLGVQEPLDRHRRDALAKALVINAPYLRHIHDEQVLHDIIVESYAAVSMGTVQAAAMLTAEPGKVYSDEPLGMLARRIAATLFSEQRLVVVGQQSGR